MVNNYRKNKAELHFIDFNRKERMFTTIPMTAEMEKMHGFIVDCDYVDGQWIINKFRLDRQHPNGRKAIEGKLTQDIFYCVNLIVYGKLSYSSMIFRKTEGIEKSRYSTATACILT